MQSIPDPKQPPLASNIRDKGTFDRINDLVKNLDIKLEQLGCLNCSEKSDKCDTCYKKDTKLKKNINDEDKPSSNLETYLNNFVFKERSSNLIRGLNRSTICFQTSAPRLSSSPPFEFKEKDFDSIIQTYIQIPDQESSVFEQKHTDVANLKSKISSDKEETQKSPTTKNFNKISKSRGFTFKLNNKQKVNKTDDKVNENSPNNQTLKKTNNSIQRINKITDKMTETQTPTLQLPKKTSTMSQEKTGDTPNPLKTLLLIYRNKVIDAYKHRQIFTVYGNYGTIRRSLLKRGWLEKLPPNRLCKLQQLPEEILLQHAKRGNEYETVIISKIINHFPAFFIWQHKRQRDMYTDVLPYRNRIRRTHMLDFSTKVGLIGCAEQQLWYLQDGVAGMLYPRFYRMGGNQEELTAFTEDYRMTQCRSLLKYINHYIETPDSLIDFENGTISPLIIDFALARVRRQLDDWNNVGALDKEATQVPDAEWDDFLAVSHKVLHAYQKFKCTYREMSEFVKMARNVLGQVMEKRPDFKWDGHKNLWILKPGYQSRGVGIVLKRNLIEILRWTSSHPNRRYIVQKYIEQPMLIYSTKFDIRQYMLLFIRESTVQIWLYKDSYMRFSSQEYNIDDLNESVHLTNNSVQKKYKHKPTRDPRLPKNNMWSLDQFKAYLKTQKDLEVWDRRVFPGFRENLIAVVMASLDETNLLENSFELYGCDFMLDEQYNPILIEINATPDLSPSTDITAQLCPLVMQDCIKVIVDLPRNNRAATGRFKLVYEVNYKFKHDVSAKDKLNINGKSVQLCKRSLKKVPNVKIARKPIKSLIQKQSAQEIKKKATTIAPVITKKSKTPNTRDTLKAATKEALALRYTMPK